MLYAKENKEYFEKMSIEMICDYLTARKNHNLSLQIDDMLYIEKADEDDPYEHRTREEIEFDNRIEKEKGIKLHAK